eukprot:COSAG01_NODE_49412_length_372_cov_0.959707_1_plen_65_part_10
MASAVVVCGSLETPSARRVGGAGPAPPPSTGRHSRGARPPRGPAGMVETSRARGPAEEGRHGEGA